MINHLFSYLLHFVGHNKDFSSASVPVAFTSSLTEVLSIVPAFQDKIIESTETFDLSIEIPPSLKHRISPGRQRKAVASIIDSTSKFLNFISHVHM